MVFNQAACRQAGFGVGVGGAVGGSDGILNAKFEFFDVKGFGDVIVSTQFEASNLIAALVFLSEKNNRNVAGAAGGAEFAADIVTIHIRQHDVQNDEVGKLLARHLERITTARRDLHLILLPTEI